MVDTKQNQAPPLPPTGAIVSDAALYNTQISLYRNTLAFGGQQSPTAIWGEMLRQGGLAIPYYREIEEKDTDVSNALDTLRDSVLKRDNWVTPADQSAQAIEVADFIQAQLDALPDFQAVLANLMDAPGYGFSLGEMIFDVSMGQANLIDILDCPQELFLFGNRYMPQIGQLQFMTEPYAAEGTPVPEQKFITCTYRMRSRDRMGRPLMRAIFWSSWFKRNMQRLWVRYAEKGPGTAAVKYADAASNEDKLQAANLAQQLIENTAVGIPANFEFDAELLKGARPINVDVYEHFYEAMQLDIVRRILGETLTSFGAEKGKGTQALGAVHAESLDDKSVQLAKWLAGNVNRQLVRPLVLWNFGPNAPMPTWGFDIDEEKDLTERLNIDKGLQGMGLSFSEAYLRETYSVPTPEATDVIVEPTPGITPAAPIAIAPNFSEGSEAGRAQADADLEQFDKIVAELQDESKDLLRTRTKEIAGALGSGRQ